jgi:MATE family multidrug resistance protein
MNDVNGPRRFSTASAILPPKVQDGLKADLYGTGADAAEQESLLGEGTTEELEVTTVGREAKLLLKYSFPLTLTYLLQVCVFEGGVFTWLTALHSTHFHWLLFL